MEPGADEVDDDEMQIVDVGENDLDEKMMLCTEV